MGSLARYDLKLDLSIYLSIGKGFVAGILRLRPYLLLTPPSMVNKTMREDAEEHVRDLITLSSDFESSTLTKIWTNVW